MDKASFAKLTVLVAVDGSPSSKDAVRHAAEIARGGDHVTLLHIVPFSSPPDYRDHAATVLQTVESFFRKHCQQVRVHFFFFLQLFELKPPVLTLLPAKRVRN